MAQICTTSLNNSFKWMADLPKQIAANSLKAVDLRVSGLAGILPWQHASKHQQDASTLQGGYAELPSPYTQMVHVWWIYLHLSP